jgi:hypothetical protein
LLIPRAATFFQHFRYQLAKLSVLVMHKTSYGQTNGILMLPYHFHIIILTKRVTFIMTGEKFATVAYCNRKTEAINLCLFWLQHHESGR